MSEAIREAIALSERSSLSIRNINVRQPSEIRKSFGPFLTC